MRCIEKRLRGADVSLGERATGTNDEPRPEERSERQTGRGGAYEPHMTSNDGVVHADLRMQ